MKWFYTPLLFVSFLLSLFLLSSNATADILDDFDGDNKIGLAEAINALNEAAVSPDGSNGLADGIFALQVTAGVATHLFDETPLLALMLAKGTDALEMAWIPGGDGKTPQQAIRYLIHLSTSKEFSPGPATLVKTVTGENQTDISGLTANTTYYGKVVAVYGTSMSEPSNSLRAKTYEVEVVPGSSATVSLAKELGLGPHTAADGTTYTFASDGPPPETGSVLYSEDADGNMTQRRVDSVSSSGGTIKVVTSDASLTDVIDTGSIFTSWKLFDIASKAPTIQSGKTAMASATLSTLNDGSQVSRMQWKDRLLTAEQTTFSHSKEGLKVQPMRKASAIHLYQPADVSQSFTATVSADFQPELTTSAQWGGLWPTQLDSAQIAAKGTLTLTALAEYNFTAAGSVTKEFRLFTKNWTSFYTVGTVPVYQQIILSMDVQVSASAQTGITASAQAQLSETVELGATYDGVKWTPYITNSESQSFAADLNILGNASAEIRLIPKIEVRFYTVLGGSLTVEPYAESHLAFENTTTNLYFLAANPTRLVHITDLGATLGVEAKVDVTLTAFGNTWDILPSTCVLGTGLCLYSFTPLTLFSIPALSPTIPTASRTGDTPLSVSITDGQSNPFDSGSIIWEAYADDPAAAVSITPGGCTSNTAVTPPVTTCDAILSTDDEGDYAIFVSGHGKLGTLARQFTEAPIKITKRLCPNRCDPAGSQKNTVTPGAGYINKYTNEAGGDSDWQRDPCADLAGSFSYAGAQANATVSFGNHVTAQASVAANAIGAYASGYAEWHDNFTVKPHDPSLEGTMGYFTADIEVAYAASLDIENKGNVGYRVGFFGRSSFEVNNTFVSDITLPRTVENHTIIVPFAFNRNEILAMRANANVNSDSGTTSRAPSNTSGQATAEGKWLGITGVFREDGTPVTEYDLCTTSGAIW